MVARRSREGADPIARGGFGTGMMSGLSRGLAEAPSALAQGAVAGSDLQTELSKIDRGRVVRARPPRIQIPATADRWAWPSPLEMLLMAIAASASAVALYTVFRSRETYGS